MRKTLLLIVFGLILITRMLAAPVTQETAARVATNFYFERSFGKVLNISTTHAVAEGSLVLFYVFDGSPEQGFVMVAADDRILPVPGYSLKGNYISNPEFQAPGFMALLGHYTQQILHHINFSLPATNEALLQWPVYNVDPADFSPASISSVAPLLGNIAWGQGCHYNADCPYDPAAGSYYCDRVPVGCVATSMVQVMKYWGYPTQGTGTASYVHSTYGPQSANFGATTYSWSSMPDQVSGAHPGVAQVNYHAGVAVQMDYGPTGSGAYTSDARNALVNHFGYLSSATFMMQNNTPQSIWESYLTSDLDLNRPVIYRGNNSVGADGHAWVIDGYQGIQNNHFHCNWGWDGYHNGYFYLAALTPSSFNFSFQQGGIFGIEPPVTQKPIADFSAIPSTVAPGVPVQFNNLTTGTVTGYEWYFGDGISSTLQHPTHSYALPGAYTVTLLATNSVGTDTMTKTNYIQVVIPPAPVADFSSQVQILPMGDTVYFTDLSTNFPTSWAWDFGDGQTSNLQHPYHIYNTVDTFTVKLYVSNISGIDSIIKTDFITTTPAPPQASFTVNPTMAYPGDTIFFTDLSLFNPDAWLWDFGDGDTSHVQNPWHIYVLPGVYTISLEVSNGYGSTTEFRPLYVYILPLPPMPKAWFAADVTTIFTGESVTFTDYSFVHPFQWEWSFPGGVPASSTDQHPVPILYPTHGSYDVQLVVWNLTGADTLIRHNFITVGTVGIDQPSKADVAIYPQPADGQLNITSAGNVLSVKIYDLSGKVIREWSPKPGSQETISLDVADLLPGIYMLQLNEGHALTSHKILIYRR